MSFTSALTSGAISPLQHSKLSNKLLAEQNRLVIENERDFKARMKMAWSMIHPDTDYAFFDLRYKYATEVFDAQVLGL